MLVILDETYLKCENRNKRAVELQRQGYLIERWTARRVFVPPDQVRDLNGSGVRDRQVFLPEVFRLRAMKVV